MPQDHPAPAVDSIPTAEAMGGPYERLLQIARDRLDGPVQTRLRSWEDGEFEIRVYHGYGPHAARPETTYRHALRYHSREDSVVEGLLAVDINSVEKTLIHREVVCDEPTV